MIGHEDGYHEQGDEHFEPARTEVGQLISPPTDPGDRQERPTQPRKGQAGKPPGEGENTTLS